MEVIRNQWYGAVWSEDLQDRPHAVRIAGKSIVLYRTGEGAVAALEDLCPHRFAPLHLGDVVDGGRLRCAYHGLEFDSNGACVRNPHTSGRIPPAARVRGYAVVERHGMIWLWAGEQDAADSALIPYLPALDADGSPTATGPHLVPTHGRFSIEMKANFGLIGENLLDLSHACVLHNTLLGNSEMADAELSVETTERGFIARRLAVDVPLPELFSLMARPGLKRGDIWTDMELIGTTCFVNHIGVSDPGMGRSGGTGIYGFNILTPIDEETTLYHVDGVFIDPPRRSPEDYAAIGQRIGKLVGYAFSEQDKIVLEAQQRALVDPSLDTSRPALFDVDIGSARYSRHLKTCINDERLGRNGATNAPERRPPDSSQDTP